MPSSKEYDLYASYLKTRSFKSFVFRKYILYPFLFRSINGAILDVGCEIGDFLRYKPEAKGCDINPLLVKSLCNEGYDVSLIQDNLLPYENNSFDVVILDNVIEHIEDPEDIVNEITRILKKGGVFVVGVPGKEGFRNDDDHKVFYDERILSDLLENFELLRFKYMPFKFLFNFLSNKFSTFSIYGYYMKGS